MLDEYISYGPSYHYPYAPCMEYLPTCALKITQMPNVGKYTLHGAYGYMGYNPLNETEKWHPIS